MMKTKGKKIIIILIMFLGFSLLDLESGTAELQPQAVPDTMQTRLDPTPRLPDSTRSCVECHSQRGLMVSFQNNESMEAHINIAKFKGSVHAALGCAGCHTEFTEEHHPHKAFGSKKQYVEKAAMVCRECHPDEVLMAKPVHAALLSKDSKAPVCTSCHKAHTVTAVAGGRTTAGEKQYCLNCHEHNITMVMRNSENASLKVDVAALDTSVHAKLSCFDCHFGFSSSEHPKRNFRSIREFSIANADSCRRCHFDKYTQTLDSIHYTVLSQGRLDAPVCTDCHGAHSVARTKTDRVKSAHKCEQCHADVYRTYASSVHGSALVNEHNADVPGCTDCHTAHSIQNPQTSEYREKVPEMCGQCHANKELMNKYGLYPGVVNSYLHDFHGVTLKLYNKQKNPPFGTERKSIATCVDCHGVHDITQAKGPGTNLVKARLTKQCAQCHPGATAEFPDAWLSHYEPSLANAPLVFGINLMYKIFIPFMLTGLILQILLHVWRYAVSR